MGAKEIDDSATNNGDRRGIRDCVRTGSTQKSILLRYPIGIMAAVDGD